VVYLEEKIKLLENLGAEFADIRYIKNKTLSIISNETRNFVTNNGISEGYSIRVLYKGNFGYKATTNLNNYEIKEALNVSIGDGRSRIFYASPKRDKITIKEKYENNLGMEKNMKEISEIKDKIMKSDKRIKSVNVRYNRSNFEKKYVSSDGRDIELNYTISNIYISAVARENDITASAHVSLSTYLGYPLEVFDINKSIEKLLTKLNNQLKGKPPKAGEFKVILSPEVSGVFAHEALGHLAEADLAIQGILGKMVGKRIAKDFVNVSDSPYNEDPMAIGITPYDDEGIEGREVKIIENGFVKEFMNNRAYAASLNQSPTGNGRAEDFRSNVLVRMRNTYFKPGDMKLDEIIREVKDGYMMKSVLGGQTSPDGTFQFGIEEGYKIEKGEITYPLRNVGIAGYTLETLSAISSITKDFSFWPGVCGKMGQSVFVGTGGPYLLVEKIKVGGING
jgi:TldD protein